ncbi:hypothetical protein NC651_034399 [Populus alba x Populus x berolinensis]|nr:hypothetical protein NC651_034399 [Populus alba x Populus x berolinensis]
MLVSLPVDSLLRFKCIFKSWHSLVNKPCFSRANFQCRRRRHSNVVLFIPTKTGLSSHLISYGLYGR